MKKTGKRLLSLLLALVLTLGLLAGCGKNTDKESPTNSNTPGNTETTTKDNNNANQSDSKSADGQKADTSEYVELTMYLIGDRTPDFDEVYAEINKILKEEVNATVNVKFLSWGEHDTKYSLLFSSGEDFDLIFTASSWCHY